MAESFPEILSRLRKERRLNQRTAAAAMHISQALLSLYENGLREPGLSFLDEACRYYGVSADYLLGRSSIRASFSGAEELPESLRRLADTGAAALHAMLDGLRTAPQCTEDVSGLADLFCYRLMRPFDSGESPLSPEEAELLSAAEAAVLKLRLCVDGAEEKLRFTIPEGLRSAVERRLGELLEEQR